MTNKSLVIALFLGELTFSQAIALNRSRMPVKGVTYVPEGVLV